MHDHQRVKLTSIEASRAFAALFVVLLHAANLMRVDHFSGHVGLGGFFDFGYVGVDFFFVLSGFIITYVHHRDFGHPLKVPEYLWRRFSRIFPIYWVVLLLSILLTFLARLATGKPAVLDMGWQDLAGTVLLLIGTGEPKYVGVAWSLQYELMFYLAFALLLVRKREGAMLLWVWGGYIMAFILAWLPHGTTSAWSNAHCLQFLMGVGVGHLARQKPMPAHPVMLWFGVLGFAAATWFEMNGPFGQHAAAGRLALGLASALLILILVGLEQKHLIRTPVWLARLGSVSYSVYLGHILVINTTYTVLLKLGLYHYFPEYLTYGIAVSAALVSTVLLGLYVELPLVEALKAVPFGRSTALAVAPKPGP
jgi:exopolysaccharide production protein ExoZ